MTIPPTYLFAQTQNCSKYVVLPCDLVLVCPFSSSFVESKSSVGRSSFRLGCTSSTVGVKYPCDPLSDSLLYPCHSFCGMKRGLDRLETLLHLVPVCNSLDPRPPICRCSLPIASRAIGTFEGLVFDLALLLALFDPQHDRVELLRQFLYDFDSLSFRSVSIGHTHLKKFTFFLWHDERKEIENVEGKVSD